ncbi:MopE-related protein [Hanstruepera marina]|uniref:MopE-related protein n=1 Tax=Hanstruepera marina TaxID=2873265 RepID=UPI001CA6F29C|nr:MopE-related protein [Hanstruepera marina]
MKLFFNLKTPILFCLILCLPVTLFAQAPTEPSTAFVVESTTSSTITISFTPGIGSSRLIVANEGTHTGPVSDFSTFQFPGVKSYGSTPFSQGSGYIVYVGPEASNITLTGFSEGTTYYFTVYEGSSSSSFFGSPVLLGEATIAAPTVPTLQASFTSFVANATSMTLNFDSGDGSNRIVLAREGGAVNAEPIDGITYSANTSFPFGSQIGSGNYVVYNGSGNTVQVNNLQFGSTYHFAIFEYNGSSGSELYLKPGDTDSESTYVAPASPATSLVFSGIDTDEFDYDFTKGSGQRRITIARQGSPVNVTPQNGIDYSHDVDFGEGDNLGDGGDGSGNSNFVVGDTNFENGFIRSLNHSTTYHIKIFEYNGSGTQTLYNTTPLSGSTTTLSRPSSHGSFQTTTNIDGDRVTLNITAGDGQGRIIIARKDAPVNVEPVDFSSYSTNFTFGNGANLGDGGDGTSNNNFVVSYTGNLSPKTITNLDANSTYYFKMFEYNGNSFDNKLFLTSQPSQGSVSGVETSATTLGYPDQASTGFTYTAYASRIFYNFSSQGNGSKRLVIARKDTPIDDAIVPTLHSSNYIADENFGAGTDLGNGHYVIYNDNFNSGNLRNVEPGATYYFRIFDFNENATESFYFTSADDSSKGTAVAMDYPSSQPTDVSFNNVLGNEMRINWTGGDGTGTFIVASTVDPITWEPQDLEYYYANSRYALSSTYRVAPNTYGVYQGTGSTALIRNLTPGTTYYFALFEYNGNTSSFDKIYLRPAAFASQTTFGPPTDNATNLTTNTIDGDRFNVSFTKGNGSRRIVVATIDGATPIIPTDGQDYEAWYKFGEVGPIPNNDNNKLDDFNYVVYKNEASSPSTAGFSLQGLQPNTTYHLNVYEYNGTVVNTSYLTVNDNDGDPVASISETTLGTPTVQAHTISFSELTGNSVKVNWVNGDGDGRILIVKEGSPVDLAAGFPEDLDDYNASSSFITAEDLGGGNFVVYDGAGSSTQNNITNLNPGTTYYFQLFEFNGINGKVYLRPGSAIESVTTLGLEPPTIPSSNMNFTDISTTRYRVNFTPGDGQRHMVIARKGSPVDVSTIPIDGIQYNAGVTGVFADGDVVGSDQYVVYDGTSSTFTLSDLDHSSTYYFKVFEYNGTGTSTLYLTDSFLTGNQATLTYPTIQASNYFINTRTPYSIDASWTNGNGQGRLVVVRANEEVNVDPVDLIEYSANSNITLGDDLGGGNIVVQQGLNDFISVTNLQPHTIYHFAVYEYNGTFNSKLYLKPAYTFSTETYSETPPTVQVSNVGFSNIGGTSFDIAFTKGDRLHRMVVARESGTASVEPQDLTNYVPNNTFGLGSEIGTGNFVVYDGYGENVHVQGLDVGTNYTFDFYEYAITADGKYYLRPALTASQATASPPNQATNYNNADPCNASSNISWSNGDGIGRIVVVSEVPLNALPVQGVEYTAQLNYTSGDAIGNGFVVYKGNSESINIVNLTPFTNYYVNIFEYNGLQNDPAYNLTALSGVIGDTVNPVASCGNITVALDEFGEATITVIDVDNGSSDNCEIDTRTIDISSFTCEDVGENTVTLTVTDLFGNTASCNATVTIVDAISPTLTPVDDGVESLDANCEFTVPDYTGLTTATDNCGTATVTQFPVAGTVLTGHDTTQEVILTANDGNGNTAETSFTITLQDAIAPVLTAVANRNENLDANCEFTVPDYTGLTTATDNCGTATVTQFPVAGTVLTGHDTTQEVILTANDGNGNTAETSFTITLQDAIAPVLTAVANRNENLDANCEFTVPDYTGLTTATDNCGTATVTQFPVAGTVLTGHDTTQEVILTANDGNGNTAETSFTITLQDAIVPVLTAVANRNENLDANCEFTVPDYTGLTTATDNCGTATVTQFPVAGTVLTGHDTTQEVILTANDGNGNTAETSFTITLQDAIVPVLTAVANRNENLDANCEFTVPDYTGLTTATDNCGTATVTQFPVAGTVLTGHDTTQEVILTANDGNGNTAETSFTITLQDAIVPALTAVTNRNENLDVNCEFTVPDYTGLTTATDNCGTATVTQFPVAGTVLTGHDTTQEVILTANDGNGNTAETSFTITLQDAILPALTAVTNRNENLDANCEFTVPDYTGLTTATDNCGTATVTQFPVAGTVLTGHDTTQEVILTANDGNGNTAETSFTITVKGTNIFYADTDNDGYGDANFSVLDCLAPSGYVSDNTDCNDNDININPGQIEILDNGKDDDCNPSTLDSSANVDNDGDGQTENEGDCDDTNPAIYAGNTEVPYNGIDDDCNAATPDDDLDGDGYLQSEDCDDNNFNVNPGATEIPDNGIDDDCNPGTPDSSLDVDNDGDGQTENEGDCDDTNPAIFAGNTETPYNGIDDDCNPATLDDDLDGDGYPLAEDCDDNNALVNPGAEEILDNGIDDDCNPATPDSALDVDNDGDGQTENEGDCDDTNPAIYAGNTEIPYNGLDDDCNAATPDDDLDGDGYPLAEDCDDNNALVNPGAEEILDNGIDDDCNPATPDSALDVDNDGDGQTENEGDCDDTNPAIYAGNTEIPYNGLDDDCNAATPDDDLDGDGYLLSEDCDDNNFNVNPGATEIPDNGIDDDCNPSTPDSSLDIDNDGDGQTENEGDCDDTNPAIYAGNVEIPDNGIDDDCNPNTPDSNDGCIEYTDDFIVNPLTHSGTGFNTVSFALPNNSQEVSFTIFEIGQKLRGNPNNQYIEFVDVYYVDEFGASILYNTYSGSNTSEASILISDIVQSVTVMLYDGENNSSGNSTMNISFSPVTFCVNNVACDSDSDGDGVCDDLDVCEGFDDMVDSDTDGIPDGCDVCPDSATDDNDNDGVCDDLDVCIGFDDNIDTDGDGVPDGCDVCPNDATDSCNSNVCAPDQILICHMKNNGTTVEMCVRENQLQRHLDHGDTLGSCNNQRDSVFNKEEVVLYPNPVKQSLTLDIKNMTITNAKVSIYNKLGQLVYQDLKVDKNNISIAISNYITEAGVYFVFIEQDGVRLQDRFIFSNN